MFLSPARTDVFESTRGFMPHDEARALHEAALLAEPGVWLEIGTYCGKSTVVLGDAAERVGATLVTVDHHRGSEENQPGWEWHDESLVDDSVGQLDTLPHVRETLNRADLWGSVNLVVGKTQQVATWWRTPVSLLFLDGNHTEEVAAHDYAAFAAHVRPQGTLLVHDVFPDPADGGRAPWQVVQRAERDGFRPTSTTGSLRALRR